MGKAKFASVLLLLQGILLILFVVFVDYGQELLLSPEQNRLFEIKNSRDEVFQSTHVMVFLGLGMVMSFLRRYSNGIFVHSLLVGGATIQWATILQGFFLMENTKIRVTSSSLIKAEFAVATVLVSLGAVVGRCNSLQYLIVAFLETLFFSINEGVAHQILLMADYGRSILVHVFGACFGMGLSRMLYSRQLCTSPAQSMSDQSGFHAFLGTMVLWVYWPTVNGAFVTGAAQERAVVNTYFALAASCVATFSFSVLASKEKRFNMLQLQNATISGGIAVGAVAALVLQPWVALLMGIIGALASVLSYKHLRERLSSRLKILDVRGIVAFHGVPGLVSAVASVFGAALAKEGTYRTSLFELYPARGPTFNSTRLFELQQVHPGSVAGLDRDALTQAAYQVAGIAMTVFVAFAGGALTGLVVRNPFFDPVTIEEAFDDGNEWEETNFFVTNDKDSGADDVVKPSNGMLSRRETTDESHLPMKADENRQLENETLLKKDPTVASRLTARRRPSFDDDHVVEKTV